VVFFRIHNALAWFKPPTVSTYMLYMLYGLLLFSAATTLWNLPGLDESMQLVERHGLCEVVSEDWTSVTQPSWREAVLVALRDRRGLVWTGNTWWMNGRDAYTILRFDSAFRKGLCQYGLFRGCKPYTI